MSEFIDGVTVLDADSHRLLTVKGAADYLAISRAGIYNLLADGELRSVRIGRSRRVALIDLRDFVERRALLD